MNSFGLVFALGALLCWSLGDFMIQRASRAFGSVKALFFIAAFGLIVLFPFVFHEIPGLLKNTKNLLLLALTVGATLFAALFDFEALRQGKFAVIQPIFGLEIPFTIAFSVILHHEKLSPLQWFLTGVIFLGVILAIIEKDFRYYGKQTILERGVMLAAIGVVGMSFTNFITAVASQETTSPLLTIWAVHGAIALICCFFLLFQGKFGEIFGDIRRHPLLALAHSILDNAAWIFFAFAVLSLPISITTAITESYIAIGVLLGILINRERIRFHQTIGVIMTVLGVLALAAVTAK